VVRCLQFGRCSLVEVLGLRIRRKRRQDNALAAGRSASYVIEWPATTAGFSKVMQISDATERSTAAPCGRRRS